MPRLWTETIEAHRREVREAILDATAALVTERGLLSVTMSEIAERAGIGRATLYKYFPDVEAVLDAWHQHQISRHLDQLAELRRQDGDAGQRLEAVLEAYAFICYRRASHEHPGSELAAVLHRGLHVTRAEHQVRTMVTELVAEAAQDGHIRSDVSPGELADYCLHALAAAGNLSSKAAVRRLATVTMTGLRMPH
ncbi:MAG: TetR family transcriptional regulator [Pseudonocardiaceae bacterium]|nr:TetR family transcriptional regulator [Pseudonocardiaceae bacterium]